MNRPLTQTQARKMEMGGNMPTSNRLRSIMILAAMRMASLTRDKRTKENGAMIGSKPQA